MNLRRLKVSGRPAGSMVPLRRPVPIPFLRVQGRRLDRAGFAVGADVRVQVERGRLVLEVMVRQRETD
ncbi:MAG TPA: SymE family type I addiction module toxin [Steroidobacteraceae bacterium]|nr:SymE family type I addiction module toxin [Steroidobacteraceae bacterium]